MGIRKILFKIKYRHLRKSSLHFGTYSQNGKKYLFVYEVKGYQLVWSRHFIVEAIAEDRGVNVEEFHDEEHFKPIQEV